MAGCPLTMLEFKETRCHVDIWILKRYKLLSTRRPNNFEFYNDKNKNPYFIGWKFTLHSAVMIYERYSIVRR